MSMPSWERERYIKLLFDYEEANNIPDDERLTYDQYAKYPAIQQVSIQKKAYVDIRAIKRK